MPLQVPTHAMKKEIPTWAVIASIAAVALIGGFVVIFGAMGPRELPAPKIKVKQEIPDHLKGRLSPEVEAQIREQTKKYGEIDPSAPEPTPRTPSDR
ncbi:MAG TPA: hypothetical protein PLH94_03705 [Fimbriimonadaceae bacterium]|nr:hypothetical protein [Fimbriimonadaceae bacterium]